MANKLLETMAAALVACALTLPNPDFAQSAALTAPASEPAAQVSKAKTFSQEQLD